MFTKIFSKLVIVGLIVLGLFSMSYAGPNVEIKNNERNDFSVEINWMNYMSDSDIESTMSETPQLRLKWSPWWMRDWYFVGSWEQNNIFFCGARTIETNMFGLGIGKNIPIKKHTKIYFDVAYYHPNYQPYHTGGRKEGFHYYMNKSLLGTIDNGVLWDRYYIGKVSGSFGVVLGITSKLPIDFLDVAVNAVVRALMTQMNIYGVRDGETPETASEGWWTMHKDQNNSAAYAGITIDF